MLIAKGYQVPFQGDKRALKLTVVMGAHILYIYIYIFHAVAQLPLTLQPHGR